MDWWCTLMMQWSQWNACVKAFNGFGKTSILLLCKINTVNVIRKTTGSWLACVCWVMNGLVKLLSTQKARVALYYHLLL